MGLTVEQFAKALIAAGLFTADEIKAFCSSLPADQPPADGKAFAKLLYDQRRLTKFQATAILSGSKQPLVLGDYVLLDKIGAGGMGQVFKAQHRHMERLAAIKLLPTSLTKDEAAVKRFQREVRAAAKLSHPHIVQTYDAGVQRSVWYLVMEYVDGRDLSAHVTALGRLPITQAISFIRQAAKGLAYAHSKGVVHRDIKPANLLLDQEGTIKILDMGLARVDDAAAKDGLTETGQVMGTVDYMAPEQAFDVHTADARADIYSLGCTLFRLLTGRSMYEAESLVKKLMAHQHQPTPPLATHRPDTPQPLIAIFERMVAKQPDDRYQTMAEVEAALDDLDPREPAQSMLRNAEPDSKLTSFLQSFSGKKVEPAALQLTTALPAPPETKLPAELSPTISLHSPQVTTDPISDRSIQVARENSANSAAPTPGPRKTWLLIAGGSAAVLLIALGVWSWFNNQPAKIDIPPGGSTTVVNHDPAPKNDPQPPAPANPTVANPTVANPTVAAPLLAERSEPVVASGKHWHGWPDDAPKPALAPFTAAEADAHQKAWATYLNVPLEWKNSIGMRFRLIPPGEFMMGSTSAEIEQALQNLPPPQTDERPEEEMNSEGPQHRVILTQPFYLGVTEVTQAEYESLMEDSRAVFSSTGESKDAVAGFDTSRNPVESVSWKEAAEFCLHLSTREQLQPFYFQQSVEIQVLNGTGYRLPTEAEWEFACRAGTTTIYSSGDEEQDLKSVGWFGNNFSVDDPAWLARRRGDGTHVVGKLAANPFGLFDMHGNVSEFVHDTLDLSYYKQFQNQPAIDPNCQADFLRGYRGGSFVKPANDCRSARRLSVSPKSSTNSRGFRVALPLNNLKADRAAAAALLPYASLEIIVAGSRRPVPVKTNCRGSHLR